MAIPLQVLSPAQLCATIEALQKSTANITSQLMGEIEMIQRIAQLMLLQVGSYSLPDPSQFIPLNLVNANTIMQLQATCPGAFPGLNTAASVEQQIQAMQDALYQSYAQTLQAVESSPLGALHGLQDIVNGLAYAASSAIGSAYGKAAQLLNCLQSVCGGVQYITNLPESSVQAIQAGYETASQNNFSVVPPELQPAYANYLAVRNQLIGLLSNTPNGFTPSVPYVVPVSGSAIQISSPPVVGSASWVFG